VVGEETAKTLPEFAWLELDLIRVIGKKLPVRIYALIGDEQVKNEQKFIEAAELQDQFLSEYRQQKWGNATDLLETIEQSGNYDLSVLNGLYSNRIEEYKGGDLSADWDGVYSATSK
jgi:adenylate cyclase